MEQEERELFFMEEFNQSTLRNVEREKLIPSPQGNHKRSLIGQEWYYYGETETEYTLFCDKIVGETKQHVFIELYADDILLSNSLIAIEKEALSQRYPIQELFPCAMTKTVAAAILRDHFAQQTN